MKHGEIVSLLGPSGCGKSTLLRCIAGLEMISNGEIFLADKKIDQLRPQNRSVGYMFQEPLLFPHLTVIENTIYGLKAQKMSKKELNQKAIEMLNKMEISHLIDAYPYQLSGGQQQRVALARALIVEPKLLLLDEPFSSLDAEIKVTLRSWLKQKLKEAKTTAIFVTHDKEEAALIADRIAVLENGIIHQIDTLVNLYENPKTRFVADFVSEGIVDEDTFIPLSKMTFIKNQEDDHQLYDYYYKGIIGSIFYKGGQLFHEVKIPKLGKELIICLNSSWELGDQITLAAKKQDVITYASQ